MTNPTDFRGLQMDYDDLSSTDEGSCCICLSVRAMKMILAVSDQFHWKTRYFSPTGTTIVLDTVDTWASGLEAQIVAGLNDCCGGAGTGEPLQLRVTAEGEVEVSMDGGESWLPSPGNDPRRTSLQFPPLPGDDGETKACQAASNLADYVAAWVEQLADVLDAGGLVVAVIAEAAAIFLSAGVLAAFAAPLGGLLISLGGSALRAAFTEGTFDDLRCCALCAYGSDGQMNTAGWGELKECVAGIGGAAGTIIGLIVEMMGVVGLNNIASSGTAAGDECEECEDCNNFCVGFDDISQYEILGYTAYYGEGSGGLGSIDSGDGQPAPCATSTVISDNLGHPGYAIVVKIPLPEAAPIGGVTLDYKYHRSDVSITSIDIDFWSNTLGKLGSVSALPTTSQDTWHSVTLSGSSGLVCDYIVVAHGGSGSGIADGLYGKLDNICVDVL